MSKDAAAVEWRDRVRMHQGEANKVLRFLAEKERRGDIGLDEHYDLVSPLINLLDNAGIDRISSDQICAALLRQGMFELSLKIRAEYPHWYDEIFSNYMRRR